MTVRAPRRPGRTVAEFARRWRMSEEKALEFLLAFERTGLAHELQPGYWGPTERALREYRIVGFSLGAEQ